MDDLNALVPSSLRDEAPKWREGERTINIGRPE